ncbi:MAG: hypothetical protein WB763_07495 [Terriglobia bacterium]
MQNLTEEFGPHYYGRRDLRIEKDTAQRVVKKVGEQGIKRIAGLKVKAIEDMDGAKMLFDEPTWLLVRGSGTEGVLRLYAEATSPEQVRALLDAMTSVARNETAKQSNVGVCKGP